MGSEFTVQSDACEAWCEQKELQAEKQKELIMEKRLKDLLRVRLLSAVIKSNDEMQNGIRLLVNFYSAEHSGRTTQPMETC